MSLSICPTTESSAFTDSSNASSLGPHISSAFLSTSPSQTYSMGSPFEYQMSAESYEAASTQGSTESGSKTATVTTHTHPNNKTGSHSTNQGCNLYVASLPPTCTDADLFDLFAPFGPIVSAKAMCKKGLKECKGYGFVLFQREEDAARAQSTMIGHVIGSNKIQVRRARGTACSPLMDRQTPASGSAPAVVVPPTLTGQRMVPSSLVSPDSTNASVLASAHPHTAIPMNVPMFMPVTYTMAPTSLVSATGDATMGGSAPVCMMPTGAGNGQVMFFMMPSATQTSAAAFSPSS